MVSLLRVLLYPRWSCVRYVRWCRGGHRESGRGHICGQWRGFPSLSLLLSLSSRPPQMAKLFVIALFHKHSEKYWSKIANSFPNTELRLQTIDHHQQHQQLRQCFLYSFHVYNFIVIRDANSFHLNIECVLPMRQCSTCRMVVVLFAVHESLTFILVKPFLIFRVSSTRILIFIFVLQFPRLDKNGGCYWSEMHH